MALTTIGLVTDVAMYSQKGLLVTAVNSSIRSVSNMISSIRQNSPEYLDDLVAKLERSDLEFTIQVIQLLIEEEYNKMNIHVVVKALEGLEDILNKVHNNLESMKKAIDYHQTKYFAQWRQFYWEGSFSTLMNLSEVLHHRYKILFELLKIYKIK